MRQLQLFTTAELARMRDRTASRNHSPERDEFRRLHAHHRAWGLVQRHGRRLHRLRTSSCTPPPARTAENDRQDGGQALAPAVVPASAAAPALAPASAGVAASVPAEQRQCSTPAAFEQRRPSARDQPTRDQHVSANRQRTPPPPHPGPAVPPVQPSLPPPTRAGHDPVRPPAEAAIRTSNSGCDNGAEAVASDPDRSAPKSSPPAASRETGRNAENRKPTPRPPRHRHRQARKMVAGDTIHAHPDPMTCQPFFAPDRPATARSP
jgi:hypothetical protein